MLSGKSDSNTDAQRAHSGCSEGNWEGKLRIIIFNIKFSSMLYFRRKFKSIQSSQA